MTRLSWLQREPVRAHLYVVLGAVLLVLGAYGYVSDELSVVWLTAGGMVLGVVGVEGARRHVVPVAKLEAAELEAATAAREVPPTEAVTER